MKTEKCFELDGAKIKEDLLEISLGKPDEEKVLLKQRHNKICCLEICTVHMAVLDIYSIYDSCIFLLFFYF